MADPIPLRRKSFREPLRAFYASHIMREPPPPQWVWDGLILRGSVTLLAGSVKLGKSLLLQQLLSCAALGRPCLGRAIEKVRAFGYFCEDPQEWLERRQLWINQVIGVEVTDYELGLSWESRADRDCILADFSGNGRIHFTETWNALWEYVQDEGCELVGIDTAAAVYNGNENNRAQVTQFLRALMAQALSLNLAIILVVHPSRGDPSSFSGSGAWLASARGGLSMQHAIDYDPITDTPRDARRLCGLGSNYSGRSAPLLFHWQEGAFVADDPEPPAIPVGPLEQMELDYRLLAGLRRAIAHGVKVPADVSAGKSLPHLARYYAADLARVPFNALYDAQDRLLQREHIIRVRVGSHCLIRPHDGPKYDNEQEWG